MVFRHINKVKNKHIRRGVYSFLGLNALFLHLVFLKTLVFNIFSLKLLVLESAMLMSIFGIVPHVTFAQTTVDYSITNSTYPVTAEEGDVVTFMYYYQNESNVAAQGVTVTTTIPAGTTYNSSQGGGGASLVGGEYVWNIPDNTNNNGLLLLKLNVSTGTNGAVTNEATISHAGSDPNTNNNTDSATVIVNASESEQSNVDLTISTQADKSQATIMDNITYTLTYENLGTQLAQDVKVYQIIPSDMYVVSSSIPPTQTDGNLYTWNRGNLGPSESNSFTITMSPFPTVSSGTVIESYAMIGSNTVESDTNNNDDQEDITIISPAPVMDINITSPNNICINQNATFTVNLQNIGQSLADDIAVQGTIPNTLSYLGSSKTSQPSGSDRIRTYVADFFPGDATSFTVTVKGTSAVNNQNIPFIVNNGNDIVGSGSTTLTILPSNDPACADGGGGGGGGGGDDDDDDDDSAIQGCTDPDAINYDSGATASDPSLCTYEILGCTNPNATNYNSGATQNDESCILPGPVVPGCVDPIAENYNSDATVDNGTCTYILGCRDPIAENYNPTATKSDNSCTYILGCRDPIAENYNPTATKSDNSCTYILGCTNPQASNYNAAATMSDGSCIISQGPIILGCTDPNASNYNPNATQDNGTCSIVGYTYTETQDTNQQPQPQQQEPKQNIPGKTACDEVYGPVFDYAQDRGLTDIQSIQEANLCGHLTRAQFARYMVDVVLALGIPSSNPNQDCAFQDIGHLSNNLRFYVRAICGMNLMGVSPDGTRLQNFRPDDPMTREAAAITFSRLLYGEEYADCPTGGPSECYIQSVHTEAYLIGNITNLDQPISLAELYTIVRRLDLSNIGKMSKYYHRKSSGSIQRSVGTTIDISQE